MSEEKKPMEAIEAFLTELGALLVKYEAYLSQDVYVTFLEDYKRYLIDTCWAEFLAPDEEPNVTIRYREEAPLREIVVRKQEAPGDEQ